jgi:hypothetical protein
MMVDVFLYVLKVGFPVFNLGPADALKLKGGDNPSDA